MVNSTCGFDPHRYLTRKGGCGAWVGYMTPEPWGFPLVPSAPHFHEGIAWCGVCARDFKIVRGEFGMAWRPREEGE